MTDKNPSGPPAQNQLLIHGKLDDQTLLSCTIGRLPRWGVPYAEDLVHTLLSPREPFPCTFAAAATRKQALRFGFIENLHDPGTWWPLLDILPRYLEVYQKISRDTSLVVFFSPEKKILSMVEYYHKLWEILQFLHDNDPEAWPASIPRQTDNEWWEFSFGGVPIFVVCSTPAHDRRRSRRSPIFVITFQPRWVFEELAADTPRGATARRVIRERLRAYDDVEPSKELGAYGNTGNREWRQYFLPDDNDDSLPGCPFRHRGQQVAVTETSFGSVTSAPRSSRRKGAG